jgi:hypothetical protein
MRNEAAPEPARSVIRPCASVCASKSWEVSGPRRTGPFFFCFLFFFSRPKRTDGQTDVFAFFLFFCRIFLPFS